MGVEIERKFLVSGDGWRAVAVSATPMRQGYLVRTPERSVRVRLLDTSAALTVKGPDGAVRLEFEYAVPAADAQVMLDELCEPGQVSKTRHLVPYGGRTWEVDVFAGGLAGLVVAEVELDDVDAAVELPPWLGREVTGLPEYTNAALSRPGAVLPPIS